MTREVCPESGSICGQRLKAYSAIGNVLVALYRAWAAISTIRSGARDTDSSTSWWTGSPDGSKLM